MGFELLDTERLRQRGKKGHCLLNPTLKILNKRQLSLLAGSSSWCQINQGHWWFKGCSDASVVVVQLTPSPKNSSSNLHNFPVHSSHAINRRDDSWRNGDKILDESQQFPETDLSSVLHSSKADYGATCSKQFLRGMLISSDKRLGGEKHRESVEARKITLKEADVRERWHFQLYFAWLHRSTQLGLLSRIRED